MPFSELFGGQNIFPSELTLLTLEMTSDVTLRWPIEQAIAGSEVFADIIRVEDADAPWAIVMPDATLAGPGQATLVDNTTAELIEVQDHDGNTIGSVPSGEVWQFYLYDNSTEAGGWATFEFGTGVSSATAAALAGAGLVAIVNTLNVRTLPETVGPATPYTVLDGDRAKSKIWTGGVGQFNFPDPATFGNSWMVWVRNSGSGNLTLHTAAAYINTLGVTDVVVPVGGSLLMVSAGTFWFTLAAAGGVAGDFNFIAINVAGSGDYTLAGSELDRISYRLTGALTGNRNVVVPNTIQQYWVSNQTSGAFDLTVKTALGTGVVVPQGQSMILASDGVNVSAWEGDQTTGVIGAAMGGTGLSAYAQGDIIYATAAAVLARLAKDTNATRYLSNQGASNAPSWNQVNLGNGVTGLLPFANLTDGSALSVLGRSVNSAGVMASIAAALDGQVLRRSGTTLDFGALDLANANAVTGDLPDGNLSANVPLKDGANIFTSTNAFTVLLATLSGDPIGYLGFPFDDDSPHSADYTLEANDDGKCVFFSAAHGAGDTVTIPANGSGVFTRLGVTILIVNDSDTDDLELAIDTDTLYLAGTTATGPFNIKPKGAVILYRTQSTEWIAMPLGSSIISPVAATTYAGYVGSDGSTGNDLPTGWTAAQDATGLYTVTHNLGSTDYFVTFCIDGTTTPGRVQSGVIRAANSFQVGWYSQTDSVRSDVNFQFILQLGNE